MRKHPEFESLPLRHFFIFNTLSCFLTRHEKTLMEKYSRGRRGAPAKGVGRATGARVQISPSPPRKRTYQKVCSFLLRKKDLNTSARHWQESDVCERVRWTKQRAKRMGSNKAIGEGKAARRQRRCYNRVPKGNLSFSAKKKNIPKRCVLFCCEKRFEHERQELARE